MPRSTPKDQRIAKMIEAVLLEAKTHKNLLQLLGATLKKLRDKNPQAADAVLRVMIETMAASMPEEKRQKFLNELITFVRPNRKKLRIPEHLRHLAGVPVC